MFYTTVTYKLSKKLINGIYKEETKLQNARNNKIRHSFSQNSKYPRNNYFRKIIPPKHLSDGSTEFYILSYTEFYLANHSTYITCTRIFHASANRKKLQPLWKLNTLVWHLI